MKPRVSARPTLWEGLPLYVSVDPQTGQLEIITDLRDDECDQPDLIRALQKGLEKYAIARKLELRDFVHGELPTEHPDSPVYGRVTACLEPRDIDPLTDVLTRDVIDELKQQLRPLCHTRGSAIAHVSYDRGIYTGVVIEYDVNDGEPPIGVSENLLLLSDVTDPSNLVAQKTTAGYWRSALSRPFHVPLDGTLREALTVAHKLGMLITRYRPPAGLPDHLLTAPGDMA